VADVDVVVIGAGLAGLRTADRLVDAGLEVVVLEARDRVGGRTESTTLDDGTPLELGGQWIGPTQDRMYELVADLGLEVFETYNTGEHVLDLGGKRSRMAAHRGAMPKLSPFVLADLAQATLRFDRLARTVPLNAPWTAPRARLLDGQTFETWIQRNLRTRVGRTYFRLVAEAVFSAESTDLSLLHTLFYVHAGTDLDTLIAVDAGAQQHRVVGGSWRIAERLADRLGDRIATGAPVRHVHQAGDEVAVSTPGGDTVTARRVVVTLPPTLAGRLEYDPPLPALRDQLTQRVPAGTVVKVFAVYDEPFWRADGLTGQAISDQGPVKVTFDNSPPSGSPGILMGFMEANDGRRFVDASVDDRRAAALECFARAFGPRARTPVAYLERNWAAEPYTRGCYGGHFTPGVWTAFGPALRRPVGRIHWAGAETADVWNGYMEGAVRSGDRAAAEVQAALA
jgi:monoamine oxidase